MQFQSDIHRRTFLARSGLNIGAAALTSLLAGDAVAAPGGLQQQAGVGRMKILHHPPRTKAVIFLCLAGGPSHLETFDYKPVLSEQDGNAMPESITAGQPIAQLQGKNFYVWGRVSPFGVLVSVVLR